MAVPKNTKLKQRRRGTGPTMPIIGAGNPPVSNSQSDPPYTSAVPPAGVEDDKEMTFQETPILNTAFEKKIGYSPEKLRKLFENDQWTPLKEARTGGPQGTQYVVPDPGTPIGRLKNRITALIRDGRFNNFRDYRYFAAIDLAYNIPMSQTTPTLIRSLYERGAEGSPEQTVKDWGLSETDLFNDVEMTDAAGAVVKKKKLNTQVFYKIFIPLVKAYTTIRLAKIYNDRNQYPFLKFEPVHYTEQGRMQCEAVTNLVQEMAADYGFPAVLRQVILGKLLYGQQFMFPSEVWHVEKQKDDEGKEYVEREGLRYQLPHPSRVIWDYQQRISSFNSDTGSEYAAHWRVMKFGDVERNPNYWNKSRVSYGTNWFDMGIAANFFTEVYPCVERIYDDITMPWNTNDAACRERMMAFYNTSDNERPVFVTDLFIKLRPCDWGLSDYEYPIWNRFVVASDCDVIWAEPIPYRPVLVDLYDPQEMQYRQSSLALEIIPFQDHLSNVLSQVLLSIKSNLAKIVMYDEAQVDITVAKDMKTEQRSFSSLQFIPFDSREAKVMQVDPTKAFVPISFPQQNTSEQMQAINTVVSVLERLLGMSSQELGAPASHEQTATESRIINTSTSTRIDYTASLTDEFIDAWKCQIFTAARNFCDDDFLTTVTATDAQSMAVLQQMDGFEIIGSREGRATIKGKWSRLDYHALVSSRDALQRVNQPGVAQVMIQSIQPAIPLILKANGAKALLTLLQQIAALAGCPKDFRFDNLPPLPPEAPDPLQGLKEQVNFKDLPDDAKAAFLSYLFKSIGYQPGPQTVMPGVQQTQQTLAKVLPKVVQQHTQDTLSTIRPLVAEVKTQQDEEMKLKAELAVLTQKVDQIFRWAKQAQRVPR